MLKCRLRDGSTLAWTFYFNFGGRISRKVGWAALKQGLNVLWGLNTFLVNCDQTWPHPFSPASMFVFWHVPYTDHKPTPLQLGGKNKFWHPPAASGCAAEYKLQHNYRPDCWEHGFLQQLMGWVVVQLQHNYPPRLLRALFFAATYGRGSCSDVKL